MYTQYTTKTPTKQIKRDTIAEILLAYPEITFTPSEYAGKPYGGTIDCKGQRAAFRWSTRGRTIDTIAGQSKVWDVLRLSESFAKDYPQHDYTLRIKTDPRGQLSDTYTFSAMVRLTSNLYVVPIFDRYWYALKRHKAIIEHLTKGSEPIALNHTLIALDYGVSRESISGAVKELVTIGIFIENRLPQNRRTYCIDWNCLANLLETVNGRLPPIFLDAVQLMNGGTVKLLTWDIVRQVIGIDQCPTPRQGDAEIPNTEGTTQSESSPIECVQDETTSPMVGRDGFIDLVTKWSGKTGEKWEKIKIELRTIDNALVSKHPALHTEDDYAKIDAAMQERYAMLDWTFNDAVSELAAEITKAIPDIAQERAQYLAESEISEDVKPSFNQLDRLAKVALRKQIVNAKCVESACLVERYKRERDALLGTSPNP